MHLEDWAVIGMMVETIAKAGKKVLVTLDDIYISDGMIAFAQMFQHLITDPKDFLPLINTESAY